MILEQKEIQNVSRMRNAVAYGQSKNSIIEWMNSERWAAIPGFRNVRGMCVVRYLKASTGARVLKIVARGQVSGEINCSF